MEKSTLETQIENGAFDKGFAGIYGQGAVEAQRARYLDVAHKFAEKFGGRSGNAAPAVAASNAASVPVSLFTSPGRTEIGGNHTDHNHGKVLAGSIDLDCICAAAPNGLGAVRIVSETFNQGFEVDLGDLAPSARKAGTVDLVKGLLQGFLERGFCVAGFDAYVVSNVISSAGVSSSASFEMLLCAIVNALFNDGQIDVATYAHIGQYAENVYWDKASGLMDQMACAYGGLIAIDFADPKNPLVERVPLDFEKTGHSLIIVNTGKGHADLSAEYSSIPREMKRVAAYFGKSVCREITQEQVLAHVADVRAYAGDRALLRALHFFEENKRVDAQVAALRAGRFGEFLQLLAESGNSSWKWLQNCYITGTATGGAPDGAKAAGQAQPSYGGGMGRGAGVPETAAGGPGTEQGITVALALTELFIKKHGRGACRVHGGGFAGVIMAMLPDEITDEYVDYIEGAIGKGYTYRMRIRPVGAVRLAP
ncbi:MAG: galactokinase [Lachnospiraceae bacterium]|nr:galactokinase [Lachnospiraceae bacterium]